MVTYLNAAKAIDAIINDIRDNEYPAWDIVFITGRAL